MNQDALAVGRTVMALERTLMAWIRTSTSLIAFGFTIYKFLHYMHEQGMAKGVQTTDPRRLGLFLIAMGTIPLIMTIVQYCSVSKRLGRTYRQMLFSPSFLVGTCLAVLGCLLLVSIVIRRDLF